MLGRLWGKKEKNSGKKKSQEVEELEEQTEIEHIEPKAKKKKVGQFQIIETKLKYKYNIKNLFEIMMDLRPQATAIHISTGFSPYFRYNGELLASDLPALTRDDVTRLFNEFCPEKVINEFELKGMVDFCHEIDGMSKFTATLRRENDGIGGVFKRVFPLSLSIDQLKLPKVYKEIAKKEEGLILISGPASSGKTSSMAALVKFISNTRNCKIIILDKNHEFIHPTKKSLVIHKEIEDNNYLEEIKNSIQEEPDVLVIDDISNAEAMRLALKAARLNILVIGGFYTIGAVKTIECVIKMFPEEKKNKICNHLSDSLIAILSQIMIKTNDAAGRKLISEILLGTPEVKVLVRENNIFQLPSIMRRTISEGMQLFDLELENLIKQNKVSIDVARDILFLLQKEN